MGFESMESIARERAATGASLFDDVLAREYERRWWAGVNRETLNVELAESCVLTQVFPGHHFTENLARLYRMVERVSPEIIDELDGEDAYGDDLYGELGIRLGVCGDPELYGDDDQRHRGERRYWAALNAAWQDEIKAREEEESGCPAS